MDYGQKEIPDANYDETDNREMIKPQTELLIPCADKFAQAFLSGNGQTLETYLDNNEKFLIGRWPNFIDAALRLLLQSSKPPVKTKTPDSRYPSQASDDYPPGFLRSIHTVHNHASHFFQTNMKTLRNKLKGETKTITLEEFITQFEYLLQICVKKRMKDRTSLNDIFVKLPKSNVRSSEDKYYYLATFFQLVITALKKNKIGREHTRQLFEKIITKLFTEESSPDPSSKTTDDDAKTQSDTTSDRQKALTNTLQRVLIQPPHGLSVLHEIIIGDYLELFKILPITPAMRELYYSTMVTSKAAKILKHVMCNNTAASLGKLYRMLVKNNEDVVLVKFCMNELKKLQDVAFNIAALIPKSTKSQRFSEALFDVENKELAEDICFQVIMQFMQDPNYCPYLNGIEVLTHKLEAIDCIKSSKFFTFNKVNRILRSALNRPPTKKAPTKNMKHALQFIIQHTDYASLKKFCDKFASVIYTKYKNADNPVFKTFFQCLLQKAETDDDLNEISTKLLYSNQPWTSICLPYLENRLGKLKDNENESTHQKKPTSIKPQQPIDVSECPGVTASETIARFRKKEIHNMAEKLQLALNTENSKTISGSLGEILSKQQSLEEFSAPILKEALKSEKNCRSLLDVLLSRNKKGELEKFLACIRHNGHNDYSTYDVNNALDYCTTPQQVRKIVNNDWGKTLLSLLEVEQGKYFNLICSYTFQYIYNWQYGSFYDAKRSQHTFNLNLLQYAAVLNNQNIVNAFSQLSKENVGGKIRDRVYSLLLANGDNNCSALELAILSDQTKMIKTVLQMMKSDPALEKLLLIGALFPRVPPLFTFLIRHFTGTNSAMRLVTTAKLLTIIGLLRPKMDPNHKFFATDILNIYSRNSSQCVTKFLMSPLLENVYPSFLKTCHQKTVIEFLTKLFRNDRNNGRILDQLAPLIVMLKNQQMTSAASENNAQIEGEKLKTSTPGHGQ